MWIDQRMEEERASGTWLQASFGEILAYTHISERTNVYGGGDKENTGLTELSKAFTIK